ncbi:hypothetical protein N781_00485 [Pontibacillus halophilus JSM 076056 = DSM 19796]|uniref:Uncharacterized protein n=1 Tax=Pontibacillus halophilus JSM 076056 = DSM 19796 TaxID=1385510 RepID=A0A0A5GS52_9BACI|nr:hypothetical protein [Pontibacillus halophilus]KGX94053.1 hypothetical protein N781_00485 [Pontibacillus halophilus JSM 076056 = DSM 19796]
MKLSKKTKRFIGLISFVIGFVASLSIVVDKWFNSQEFDGKFLFFSFFFLHFILKYVTWGKIYENEEENEFDKQIKAKSSRMSYYIIMMSSITILYFFSDSENYPLLVTVGLILVTLPLTEFLYSKRYKNVSK